MCVLAPLTEEIGATFIPTGPEAWTPHPLAAYAELAPNAATAATIHHHAALIQHPALAQMPVGLCDLTCLLHFGFFLAHFLSSFCSVKEKSMEFQWNCELIVVILFSVLNMVSSCSVQKEYEF